MIGENDEDSGAPCGDVLCTLICSGRRFAAFNRVHTKCCAEEREIILRHCIIVSMCYQVAPFILLLLPNNNLLHATLKEEIPCQHLVHLFSS